MGAVKPFGTSYDRQWHVMALSATICCHLSAEFFRLSVHSAHIPRMNGKTGIHNHNYASTFRTYD